VPTLNVQMCRKHVDKRCFLLRKYCYYVIDGKLGVDRESAPITGCTKVNKANQIQKNIQPRQVTLYRNVFYSRVSTAVVLCLCTSFLLQPVERIYAAELNLNEAATPEIVNLAVDAGLAESTPAPEIITTDTSAPAGGTASYESEELGEGDGALATSTSTSTPVTESGNEPTGTTTVYTDEEIADMIAAEGAESLADITESTSTATSTDNPVAISTVYSDAVMQFNRNDCVTVEDGSFYCQTKKDDVEQGSDGMYALQDKDGDLEIFLQKNGELTQLTFNTVDDAAPYFDTSSNSIVWHRLVDERYQIIAFDLDTNQEVQLTADNVNNMEPSRSGVNTMWQRWNGDNWDIVLYDGRETKFITDSQFHDIAPNIKGDLVMWNRLLPDTTQTIELYDLVTGEFTTITDDEGGALSNPRMVLVYETQFANGDVITKGYDVDTGEITPLANNPAELPEELPEPDATGETRALLQPKNPVKEDSEVTDDIFPITGGSGEGNASSSAASTTSATLGDLHITPPNPAIAGSTPSASTTQTVTEFTLDLTPPATLNPDIPADLVITPFVNQIVVDALEISQ
jgi:hypothetical protein